MCASFNGMPCHTYYTQLFAAFQDGANCFGDLMSPGSCCSTDRHTDIDLDVRNYGCCVNVPINYFAANDSFRHQPSSQHTLYLLSCPKAPQLHQQPLASSRHHQPPLHHQAIRQHDSTTAHQTPPEGHQTPP